MRYSQIISKIKIDPNDPLLVPKPDLIFKAFELCPATETKIIILGQDPYPNPENATGLAFSVPRDRPIPPSLRQVYKELGSSVLGFVPPNHGDLTSWAKQGVLLLNTILTTKAGKSLAHEDRGWEEFTTKAILRILSLQKPIVIMAWGSHAQEKLKAFDFSKFPKAKVLKGGHPSPLNRKKDFVGGDYFNKANDWLEKHGETPINWNLGLRVIVAGSRTINSLKVVSEAIKASEFDVLEVVSGGARGVDSLGEAWAHQREVPIARFLANWERLGKRAGPERNSEMVDYADALVAIWDGKSRGTADTIKKAKEAGLSVYVHKVKA